MCQVSVETVPAQIDADTVLTGMLATVMPCDTVTQTQKYCGNALTLLQEQVTQFCLLGPRTGGHIVSEFCLTRATAYGIPQRRKHSRYASQLL